MTTITAALDLRADFLSLLEEAAAAHANIVQLRLDGVAAIMETLATGTVVARAEGRLADCAQMLPAIFALADGLADYTYGDNRSTRMTGEKAPLPPGVAMVFLQFFPARDGQRHLVARITYDGDTCCGTCGG